MTLKSYLELKIKIPKTTVDYTVKRHQLKGQN